MVGTLGAMTSTDPSLFDQVVNLCKRRSFVFPSAEIYGGFRSTYDYGPLGVLIFSPSPAALRACPMFMPEHLGQPCV